MLPLMVVMVGNGHTYHWRRLAVLSVRPAGWRYAPRVLVVAVAAMFGAGWALTKVLGLLGAHLDVLLVTAGVLVAGVAAFGLARAATVFGRGVKPLPQVHGPTTARWVADLAVAAPGLDAIETVFEPHLRSVVPTGEVVTLLAATERLAHVYAAAGFERTTKSRRRLYVTA
ncbi:hypothetical protein N866_03335 [Actinotalea ferrariae CF5-4]|uniref:Uncharacterized protein n=1 Tax=Actinotalea ferrariae CF5-4 TaxID=948458 RepID=A0A021VY13_9CELL|nr:hypothetical protein [Actinotalea ferrariae]EYR64885.1 hypothetical protein N866_03335 [Actinotalea ferrariae CF5-4]